MTPHLSQQLWRDKPHQAWPLLAFASIFCLSLTGCTSIRDSRVVVESIPKNVLVRPLTADRISMMITALPTPSNWTLRAYAETTAPCHHFQDMIVRKVKVEQLVDWHGKESTRRTVLEEKESRGFAGATTKTNALAKQSVVLRCMNLQLPEIRATTGDDGECTLDFASWRQDLHPRDELYLRVTVSTNQLTATEETTIGTDMLFTPLQTRQWDAAVALKDAASGYAESLEQAEKAGAHLFCPKELDACKLAWKSLSDSTTSSNPPNARAVRQKSLVIEAQLRNTVCREAREARLAMTDRAKRLNGEISALIVNLDSDKTGSLDRKRFHEARTKFSQINVTGGIRSETDYAALIHVVEQYESVLKKLQSSIRAHQ